MKLGKLVEMKDAAILMNQAFGGPYGFIVQFGLRWDQVFQTALRELDISVKEVKLFFELGPVATAKAQQLRVWVVENYKPTPD